MRLTCFICALLCGLCTQLAFANSSSRAYRPIDNKNAPEESGPWKESDHPLPDYPNQPDWIGFFVPLKTNYKFFVDSKTLTVGQDGVVRYVLRVMSPSGAENISYEGIHCRGRESRAYAFGDSVSKKWYASTRVLWKKLSEDDMPRKRLAEDLCVDWQVPADAAQALTLLKKAPWL